MALVISLKIVVLFFGTNPFLLENWKMRSLSDGRNYPNSSFSTCHGESLPGGMSYPNSSFSTYHRESLPG